MSADQLTLDVPAGGIDDYTAAVLACVSGDPLHAGDRRRIVQAIVTCARDSNGYVDINQVRTVLDGQVFGNVVGAVFSQLAHQRILEDVPGRYVRSTDTKGRNSGKIHPLRRLRADRLGGAL